VPIDDRVLLYLPGDGNANDNGPLENHGEWCVPSHPDKCTGNVPPYVEGHDGPGSEAFGFEFQANELGYIKVNDTDLPLGKGGSSFTMAAWFKADDFAAQRYQMVLCSGSFQEPWSTSMQLYTNNGSMKYGFENCQQWASPSSGPFQEGVWYHVAMTYEHPSIKLYINGTLEGDETCSNEPAAHTPSALGVGGNGGGYRPFRSGGIDEVVVLDYALSSGEIEKLMENGMCKPQPSCVPIDDRILLYLPGDGHANDYGPLENHGEWCVPSHPDKCAGKVPPYVEGHDGPGSKAFGFDFQPDELGYIKVNDTDLPLGENRSSFSMAAWFKGDDFAAQQYQMVMCSGSYRDSWSTSMQLYTKKGKTKMKYGFQNCQKWASPSSGPFLEGQWYHVAMTYDHPSIKLYINGILVGDEVCLRKPPVYSPSALGVGGKGGGNWPFVSGGIDEVVVSNYALSLGEVQQLMDAGICHDAVAPTLTATEIPGRVKLGRALTAVATGTDPEDPDNLSFSIDWDEGEDPEEVPGGAPMTCYTTGPLTHTFSSLGYHDVTFTVTDSNGLTDSRSMKVYVSRR